LSEKVLATYSHFVYYNFADFSFRKGKGFFVMSSSVLRSFLLGLILLAPFSTSYSQVGNSIYDFGDHTSVTLVTKAWDSLTQKDFNAVAAYTKKCIELYGQKAVEQQASLTDFAPSEKAFDYWALNDVGTAYFILGKA
jgi:hypothetical protein